MSTWMWVLLGILLLVLYLTALFVVGFATLRKGHTILFCMGVIFPLLWIIGALMRPVGAVSTAEARRRLRQASLPPTRAEARRSRDARR
jgi:membrane protein implicated in regulation of membrane protease activity